MQQTLAAQKEGLVLFLEEAVEAFLEENPSLCFYAFAIECNAETTEISLAFNTEDAIGQTIAWHQQYHGAQHLHQQALEEIRYNPSDWEYADFAGGYLLPKETLAALYSGDTDTQTEECMSLCCEAMAAFMQTDTWESIPKTGAFRPVVMGKGEDFADAEARLRPYLKKPNPPKGGARGRG